jgi:hypothetical protein
MPNIRNGVPKGYGVQPAGGRPDPTAPPQIQHNCPISLPSAITSAIQAPPPTPISQSP